MLKVRYSTKFKKDYKVIYKRGYDIKLFQEVVSMLCEEMQLPIKYKDHTLIGNWAEYRECHITADWLLVYKVESDILVLTLTRTGSHSDLF